MRAWHWIGFVVCGAMTALVVLQWRGSSKTAVEPMPGVAVPVTGIAVDSNDLARLRESTRELPRLRNEVGQLRAKRAEIEAARREHAQLVAEKETPALPPRVTPPGFVSKESLANVGFATPEDAVQTLFWALREGSLRAMLQAISPSDKERQRMENLSPEAFADLERKWAEPKGRDQMKGFSEFGVRAREVISDDAVVLHVGPSFSTNTMKFRAERTAEGWKIRDPFSK